MPVSRADRVSTIEAAIWIRKCFEAAECGVEQPYAPAQRAALEMVIRRRKLNQSLEVLIEIRLRGQPDLFPRFVSVPEFSGVEVFDAAEEMRAELRFLSDASLLRAFPGEASRTSRR